MSDRCFFFFKQKTAYEMRISDWSSDVCSSDLDNSRPIANRDRGQRVPASVTAMTQARIRARVPIPLLAATAATTFNKAVALESFRNRILEAVDVALIDLFGNLTGNRPEIGSAHVRTPVTNAHHVCRLLLEKHKK